MYCKNCGKELEEGSNFCAYCGTKVVQTVEKKEKPESPVGVQMESEEGKNTAGDAVPEFQQIAPEDNLTANENVWKNQEEIGQGVINQLPKGKYNSEEKKKQARKSTMLNIGVTSAIVLVLVLTAFLISRPHDSTGGKAEVEESSVNKDGVSKSETEKNEINRDKVSVNESIQMDNLDSEDTFSIDEVESAFINKNAESESKVAKIEEKHSAGVIETYEYDKIGNEIRYHYIRGTKNDEHYNEYYYYYGYDKEGKLLYENSVGYSSSGEIKWNNYSYYKYNEEGDITNEHYIEYNESGEIERENESYYEYEYDKNAKYYVRYSEDGEIGEQYYITYNSDGAEISNVGYIGRTKNIAIYTEYDKKKNKTSELHILYNLSDDSKIDLERYYYYDLNGNVYKTTRYKVDYDENGQIENESYEEEYFEYDKYGNETGCYYETDSGDVQYVYKYTYEYDEYGRVTMCYEYDHKGDEKSYTQITYCE